MQYYRQAPPARRQRDLTDLTWLNQAVAEEALNFHRSFSAYAPTDLHLYPETAQALGLGQLYVKNEAQRFGLNAFKALGSSYAMGKLLAERLGRPIEDLPLASLVQAMDKGLVEKPVLVTATDGNHGHGLAWTARLLGLEAVVYMPEGSSPERLLRIQNEGAEAQILPMNYNACVRHASAMAQEKGWILVQDSAFDGYERIPRWIIQGYTSMALEAYRQMPALPTHLFIQAGVGALTASMVGFYQAVLGDLAPLMVVLEAKAADCFYRTASAQDGQIHTVDGALDTLMAGLACGVPCALSWPVLRDYADAFLSCPDEIAAQGMRILAHPVGQDKAMISGESGAACVGAVSELMRSPRYQEIRDDLQLDQDARVLCFSTEGNTDPGMYQKILWDGAYPRTEA